MHNSWEQSVTFPKNFPDSKVVRCKKDNKEVITKQLQKNRVF